MEKVRPHEGMTGSDLRLWREQQPGEYEARNGEKRVGWSQQEAADWYGVHVRTWRAYELGERKVPRSLVKRMQAYETSFEKLVDQIFEESDRRIQEWGSPFPELQHEYQSETEE